MTHIHTKLRQFLICCANTHKYTHTHTCFTNVAVVQGNNNYLIPIKYNLKRITFNWMELDGLPSTVMPPPAVTLTFDLLT